MRKKICDLYGYIILAAAVIALAAAFWAEHKAGIKPCLLCIYQRYGWMILGLLALGAVSFSKAPLSLKKCLSPKGASLILGFFCLSLSGLATYQVLIEEKYVEAPQACKAAAHKAQTTDELWESLTDQPLAPCDQTPFKWGGFSLAAYNGLLTAALAILCFLAWFYYPSRRNRS